MEVFYRTHNYLVEHTNAPVRRDLMDEIDWSARLIGIKGTRGVGKTTFLLQYGNIMVGVLYSPPGCDRDGNFRDRCGFSWNWV